MTSLAMHDEDDQDVDVMKWAPSPSGCEELRLPARTSRPPTEACAVNVWGNLRLVVPAAMSDELWKWLMDEGWRLESYRPDRRRYREIPTAWVAALIDAEPAFRETGQFNAVLSVQGRPTQLASRIDRHLHRIV